MDVCVLKLNGWSDTYDERIDALSEAVDHLTLIRPETDDHGDWEPPANVTVYDLPPRRGTFVNPSFLKPLVFSIHVLQAVVLFAILVIFRQQRPDVIHAIDYALGGVAGVVASTLFSVPLVVSVRGLKEPRYRTMMENKETFVARVNYRILTILSGWTLANADHIVTKSSYQVEFVRDNLGVVTEFSTIPTGVDFEKFDPSTITEMNAISELLTDEGYSLPPDPTIVLYLGKLIPEKGPKRIIELVAQTEQHYPENVVFVFLGEFRDREFETQLKELQQDISDRVIICSRRIPFEDVPKFIKEADAMTLFSAPDIEGVPRILQESCVMETPIIASDVTGIAEAFDSLPGCYLIARNDAEGFKKAINEIAENTIHMDRSIFREQFDMYRNYGKYADIYESVLAKAK